MKHVQCVHVYVWTCIISYILLLKIELNKEQKKAMEQIKTWSGKFSAFTNSQEPLKGIHN